MLNEQKKKDLNRKDSNTLITIKNKATSFGESGHLMLVVCLGEDGYLLFNSQFH